MMTKAEDSNALTLSISDSFLSLMEKAKLSDAAQKGFGCVPNEADFIKGVIYYWIRKNTPELLEETKNISEIIEHKKMKSKP